MADAGNLFGRTNAGRRNQRGLVAGDRPAAAGRHKPVRPRSSGQRGTGDAQQLKLHVLDSMDAARTIWRSFERRVIASPFQTFTWLSAWFDNVGEAAGVSPVIVFGYDQSERLLLLMPLGITTANGVRTLSWLGDDLAGYNAPLVDPALLGGFPPKAVEGLWQSIIAHLGNVDILKLRRQPRMLGQHRNPFVQGARIAGTEGGRLLELPSTWMEFAAEHIGEGRHTGGDYARHLRQRGRLTIGLNLPTQVRSRVIERILVAARSRPGRRARKSPLLRQGVGAFLKTLALSESTGFFSVSAVNIDDELVAASVAYVHGNRYFVSLTSLEDSDDGRAAECLLCEELIRSCIVQGIEAIDFLGGTAAMPQWTQEPIALYESFSGQSAMGHTALGLNLVKRAIGFDAGDRDIPGGVRQTFAPRD